MVHQSVSRVICQVFLPFERFKILHSFVTFELYDFIVAFYKRDRVVTARTIVFRTRVDPFPSKGFSSRARRSFSLAGTRTRIFPTRPFGPAPFVERFLFEWRHDAPRRNEPPTARTFHPRSLS